LAPKTQPTEIDMSTSEATSALSYDVFVNDPPPQDGLLPNGEPKRFSPEASTLIYGSKDAVLTDPPLTADQARVLGDWVAAKGRNLTDIFITHGHGDHWFAAGPLAERFGARVVASAGTIEQMHASVALRPLLWDKVYTGIPRTPVTAVTVPDNRFALEGHELVVVEVGDTDSADTSAEARRQARRPKILDSLIAATARALDVPVYTQDTDFDEMPGVRVVRV
jgi:predicted nucleic acid-binding protein